jgi:hypothetical protein
VLPYATCRVEGKDGPRWAVQVYWRNPQTGAARTVRVATYPYDQKQAAVAAYAMAKQAAKQGQDPRQVQGQLPQGRVGPAACRLDVACLPQWIHSSAGSAGNICHVRTASR